MKAGIAILALCASLLAACARLQPSLLQATPAPTFTPQPVLTLDSPLPAPAIVTPTSTGKTVLRVWLPPRFDPNSGNQAGELLKGRLEEFKQLHPEVQLEVRMKALSGAGGLLDSLITTSLAAPQAMPDVVALSRESLETAALKGVLHTYSDYSELKDGPDWFDYARQLGQVHDSVYGLPFAGDFGLVVYRAETITAPPADWPALLSNQVPFIFAASDANALFTLTQYLALGGAIQDSQGQPYLDPVLLEKVLNFYAEAHASGVMPEWLTQIEDHREAWDSFIAGNANQVFGWSSSYLSTDVDELAVVPPPTPDASMLSLAGGWVWALSSPDENRLHLGMELAAFLVESQFMAEWTLAAGYLPPRPNALQAWTISPNQQILSAISRSARLQPSADLMIALGKPLMQATDAILSGESDPASLAAAAASSVNTP